jgi:hypothetical protein
MVFRHACTLVVQNVCKFVGGCAQTVHVLKLGSVQNDEYCVYPPMMNIAYIHNDEYCVYPPDGRTGIAMAVLLFPPKKVGEETIVFVA